MAISGRAALTGVRPIQHNAMRFTCAARSAVGCKRPLCHALRFGVGGLHTPSTRSQDRTLNAQAALRRAGVRWLHSHELSKRHPYGLHCIEGRRRNRSPPPIQCGSRALGATGRREPRRGGLRRGEGWASDEPRAQAVARHSCEIGIRKPVRCTAADLPAVASARPRNRHHRRCRGTLVADLPRCRGSGQPYNE